MATLAVTAIALAANANPTAHRSREADLTALIIPDQPPSGEWLATAHVRSVIGTINEHPGSMLVRAWNFDGICRGSSCEEDFTRELVSGQLQETALARTAHGERGTFGATSVACVRRSGQAPTQAREVDSFVFPGPAAHGRLLASETATLSDCGGGTAQIVQDWSATYVNTSAAPSLPADPRHDATEAAFIADGMRECAAVNASLAAVAAGIKRQSAAASISARGTSAARAASAIAALFSKIVPIVVHDYTALPQPPAPFGQQWPAYGDAWRVYLADLVSFTTAVASGFRDLGHFNLTGDAVAQQTALAELAIGAFFEGLAHTNHDSVTGLASSLQLPAICAAPTLTNA